MSVFQDKLISHPWCHEVTQSCVGTKPFLPTPAAAMRSRLSDMSIDSERERSGIFPRAFSDLDGAPVGVSVIVGDISG